MDSDRRDDLSDGDSDSAMHARLDVREAIARHERYSVEFVERYAWCPWAKSARERGRLRRVVVDVAANEVTRREDARREGARCDVHAWMAACVASALGYVDDESAEVVFLIAPSFGGTVERFTQLADLVRASPVGQAFAIAPFYFDAERVNSMPTIELLRQSPDPTLQLVRYSTLDAVRAADPPRYVDTAETSLTALLGAYPNAHASADVHARVRAFNEQTLGAVGRDAVVSQLMKLRDR